MTGMFPRMKGMGLILGGNGFAHAAPKNITHDKCNFNPKYKGWRPKWVCDKMEIKYKEWDKFEH